MLGILLDDDSNYYRNQLCHVYEVYPQSRTPKLTLFRAFYPPLLDDKWREGQLFPDTVVWCTFTRVGLESHSGIIG